MDFWTNIWLAVGVDEGLERGGRLGSERGVFSMGIIVGFEGGEDPYPGIGASDERAVLVAS